MMRAARVLPFILLIALAASSFSQDSTDVSRKIRELEDQKEELERIEQRLQLQVDEIRRGERFIIPSLSREGPIYTIAKHEFAEMMAEALLLGEMTERQVIDWTSRMARVNQLKLKEHWLRAFQEDLQKVKDELAYLYDTRNRASERKDLAGAWNGGGWGQVIIRGINDSYTGTFTSTKGEGLGRFSLKRVDRNRYEGDWTDSDPEHYGTFSAELVNGDLQLVWLDTGPRGAPGMRKDKWVRIR